MSFSHRQQLQTSNTLKRSTCIALDALVALVDRSLVALEAKILEAFGSSNWIAAIDSATL